MDKLTKNERIELLREAQEKLFEVIELIEEAVDGTSCENSAQAYIIGHLSNWAEGNNPYDEHIPRLIEEMEDEEV